jgi:hypothetical protein
MPLTDREWAVGRTFESDTERLEDEHGEDAVRVYTELFQNPEKAFTADELFYGVFDPGPFYTGVVTTNDDGERIEKTRDRSQKFEEAIERLSTLLVAMDDARFIESRVIETTNGSEVYYRLSREY